MNSTGTKSNASAWLVALVLGLVTVWLFWPATQDDFSSYDDPLYVTANPYVEAGVTAAGLKWAFCKPEAYYGYWHPLTLVSHMLDCQMYGQKPWGHHLTGVLLEAVNTMLVFVLLYTLTGALWRSATVAALFGWHPLRVESVAWVSEHKGLLSAMFGLLSLWAYVRHARGRNLEPRTKAGKIYYWLALVCLACGLLCKPVLVTWPVVMLLLDYWPLERFSNVEFRVSKLRGLIIEKIPFFVLVVAMCVITVGLSRQAGALDADRTLSLGTRVGTALIGYCWYLEKTFWPTKLAVFYPHPGHWPVEEVLLAGVVLVMLSALIFRERRRFPFLWMGWLWFVITLAPVCGILQVGSQAMADRYTYIPSIGLLVGIVWTCHELTKHWRGHATALTLAVVAAALACAGSTRVELSYWRNDETLFTRALAVTDDNFLAHKTVGDCDYEKGRVDEAIGQYREAIRERPDFMDAHNNLGIALNSQGRTDEAIGEFREAIRLKPDYDEAHNNLGLALGRKGQIDDAVGEFIEAIRLNPDYADAHNDLGIALIKKGQLDEAISQFQEAVRLKPGYAEAKANLEKAEEFTNKSKKP